MLKKRVISIIGDGAVGMFLSSMLLKNPENDITLYSRKSTSSSSDDEVNRKTRITVGDWRGLDRIIRYDVRIQSTDNLSPESDVVIICVKSFHIEQLIEQIRGIIPDKSVLLSIMNGMGYQDNLSGLVDKGLYYCGLNTYGITRLDERVIQICGDGQITVGNYDNIDDHSINELLSEMFRMTSINIDFSSDIKSELWKKVAVNACINPVASIYQCKNGELRLVKNYDRILRILVSEIVNVAKSKNIIVSEEDYINSVYNVIDKTSENKNSMLQDIKNSRENEIESINGFIVNMGKDSSIDTKFNEFLYLLIRGLNT